jgi:hypothetical protein
MIAIHRRDDLHHATEHRPQNFIAIRAIRNAVDQW